MTIGSEYQLILQCRLTINHFSTLNFHMDKTSIWKTCSHLDKLQVVSVFHLYRKRVIVYVWEALLCTLQNTGKNFFWRNMYSLYYGYAGIKYNYLISIYVLCHFVNFFDTLGGHTITLTIHIQIYFLTGKR